LGTSVLEAGSGKQIQLSGIKIKENFERQL
jgi:hypothetical protein